MHHGLLIDAGSGGSRIHVFQWEPRVFHRLPAPLSRPVTAKDWSARLAPGISAYADDPPRVAESLQELLDFGRQVLKDDEASWPHIPIYLKATAGMRALETGPREEVMTAVRDLLSNKTFCPFEFKFDYARVLSGEEEGAFGWIGVNSMLKRLDLDSADISHSRAADPQTNTTFGSLDLGGESTQISFFRPEQDILANLYKVQIGQEAHWNIYTHSFLMFGRNAAFDRLREQLAEADPGAAALDNPCLQRGWADEYAALDGRAVAFTGTGDMEACLEQTLPLLRLANNEWCDYAHSGECSFAGVYQPPLYGRFYAFNGFANVLLVPGVDEFSDLCEVRDRGAEACAMSADELAAAGYDTEQNYCWMAGWVVTLLHEGWGFPLDDSGVRWGKEVDGQPIGWPVGSMTYELNTQPWELSLTEHCYSNTELWVLAVVAAATLALWPALVRKAGAAWRQRGYASVPL